MCTGESVLSVWKGSALIESNLWNGGRRNPSTERMEERVKGNIMPASGHNQVWGGYFQVYNRSENTRGPLFIFVIFREFVIDDKVGFFIVIALVYEN